MGIIKPDASYGKAVFSGFPGCDSDRIRDGTAAASESVNFRITSDGTLKKRCGYGSVLQMPGEPRAIYSGYLYGEEVFYFLVEDTVYARSDEEETGYRYVGSVASHAGDAEFTVFLGDLYLFDGTDVYVLQQNGFTSVEGYVPHYGSGWDPEMQGEVFEEENMLTRRVRISYLNPNGCGEVYFGRSVKSIDYAVIDGEETDAGEITLLSSKKGCSSKHFSTAASIELLVTLDTENRRSAITGCRRAFVYGEASDSRMFCFEGAEREGVYASTPVPPTSISLSEERAGTLGGGIYFPISAPICRVDAPVTALCRYYDRLLIFTASGAWAVDCTSTTECRVTPAHSTVGCDKRDCAVLCGNVPITYFGGKLWKWSAKNDSVNDYTAEVFSAPMAERFSSIRDGKILMQYYAERSELWVSREEDADGCVLIYNTASGVFYTFEHVFASRLIASRTEPMLMRGSELMAFDEALSKDLGYDDIRAVYRSGWLDFGHPERTKHLQRYFLLANPGGGLITVRFETERGRCAATDITGSSDFVPCTYDRRAALGRFNRLRFSLEASGEGRSEVSCFTVTVRK